jgi:UDP-3-O-[3-hydroxymyristoyl] glucosamine N-acyltransferase
VPHSVDVQALQSFSLRSLPFSVHSSKFRPATPLFATLTRTVGVWGYSSHFGTRAALDGSLYFPLPAVRDSQAAPQRIEEGALSMKLAEVAQRLECRLEGPPELEIRGVAGIEHAEAGQITFLANRRYFPLLKTTRASAVLVEEGITLEREASQPALAALRSGNPYLAFAQAIELFYQPPRYAPGIHPTAIIANSARIGEGAHVGPYCYVDEDVEIGRHAVLHSFVAIYRGAKIGDDFFSHAHAVVREFCRLGDRVILQNGVVIGGDGFGFAKQKDGTWQKMLQAGPAVLEDDVEVQANSCVDRATIGETRIGRGAKIDDLVLVGHGSRVGANTLLCGQVGLAGSTKVGSDCILAGQVGSGGHLTIGDRTLITAQSGIPHDLAGNTHYSGSPCVDHRQWLKNAAALNRMPDVQKRLRELEAEIEKLKSR